MSLDWLTIRRGAAPLILSIPHGGKTIPADYGPAPISPWLARRDADWWQFRLYGFAELMDVTIVRTAISRTVIDLNRDPSGASLYPGQATTALCPTTTFDGDPLYPPGVAPDAAAIAARRAAFFDPYHAALAAEIARLKAAHPRLILYDCHSIRSVIPRLFAGVLPNFNIGTNDDKSCDPALTARIEAICAASGFSHVVNGRFKGGWITRHYGDPGSGVHALQMELACRGYMTEPEVPSPDNWPTPYDPELARPLQIVLRSVLRSALEYVSA